MRIIQTALAAVGAPENLVEVITGYATLYSFPCADFCSKLT